MGYIAHDAVIVTCWDDGTLPDMDAFRASLPERWRRLVIGPVTSVVNGYTSFAFLPDGSKEGWSDSADGDTHRRAFVSLFEGIDADAVSVTFGGDYTFDRGVTVKIGVNDE